jgi:hypothetical protein
MWPIAGAPDGSFYFDNQPKMLDQFLVKKNMAIGDGWDQGRSSHGGNLQLPAMVIAGTYPKPIPFGRMGKR